MFLLYSEEKSVFYQKSAVSLDIGKDLSEITVYIYGDSTGFADLFLTYLPNLTEITLIFDVVWTDLIPHPIDLFSLNQLVKLKTLTLRNYVGERYPIFQVKPEKISSTVEILTKPVLYPSNHVRSLIRIETLNLISSKLTVKEEVFFLSTPSLKKLKVISSFFPFPFKISSDLRELIFIKSPNVIGSWIYKFLNLTRLKIQSCFLKDFQLRHLHTLKRLETLDLNNNCLTKIPNDIFLTLTNLKYLDVSLNNLKSLAFNNISLVKFTVQMQSLQVLILDDNPIFRIGHAFLYLQPLTYISCLRTNVSAYQKKELKRKFQHQANLRLDP